MKNGSPLHHALSAWLGQACTDWAHLTHLKTCVAMVAAMIYATEVNLTRWLPYLPFRDILAQSKQRRVQRWLHNERINVHRLYKPLIQAALADWQDSELYLSLDTSVFWQHYCLIRVAVVHRGRTLPVVWRVKRHSSASVSFAVYREVLEQARRRLPDGVRVILLADRGFVHTELMSAATGQWGWHYRIRIKQDSWIWRPGKGWTQLGQFHFRPGEAWCLHNVRLHKEQSYGPVHGAVGRNNVNGEFWAIVSDEPTSLQTFSQYGLRFSIEESFLDEQSNGWQVHSSRIRSCCALSRLWFLLAVATLYLSAQGVAVVAQGQRRWVDAHWFRGSSYLRLGWDWVRAAAFNGWRLIRSVSFTGNRDPMPAMASHKQHQRRLYRLEFQVQTFRYLPD